MRERVLILLATVLFLLAGCVGEITSEEEPVPTGAALPGPTPPDAGAAADAAPPDAAPIALPPPPGDAAPVALPPPPPVGRGAELVTRASSGEQVVFTGGARTVRFEGPARVFTESKYGVSNTVVTTTWVRLLPAAFDGALDRDDVAWMERSVASNASLVPDILGFAMDYVDGAPAVFDSLGRRVGGDAGFGPTDGADWNDYLMTSWRCQADGSFDDWEREQAGNLDCSGFVRIVFGFRGGVPLSHVDHSGTTLPRQSFEIFAYGPGVVVIADRGAGVPAAELAKLAPGDLVFFDAKPSVPGIDHAGIFLGIDTQGQPRMVNSRNSMCGPTFRDGAGPAYGESSEPSVIAGPSLYGRSFRAARRL